MNVLGCRTPGGITASDACAGMQSKAAAACSPKTTENDFSIQGQDQPPTPERHSLALKLKGSL